MDRRTVLASFTALLAVPLAVGTQSVERMPRIAVVFALFFGLLVGACVAVDVREGQSGAVAWQVVEKAKTPAGWTFTVLLQETAGVGIEFQTVQAAYPLPPTGHGLEWHGGIRDWPFFRRLDANSEIRATFSPTFLMRVPDYADLEFRGIGDDFKAIRVPIRVYLR